MSFSSCEPEVFGATMASKEAVFLRELLHDLGHAPTGATRMYSDSKSAVDLSLDPVSFKKTKHILVSVLLKVCVTMSHVMYSSSFTLLAR